MELENKYKAAALISLADKETAKEILKDLSQEEVALLGKASLELEEMELDEELLEDLEKKVKNVAERVGALASLEEDELADILRQSLGEDKGNELFGTIQRSILPQKIGRILEAYSADDLYLLLKEEPLQAVAVVTTYLSPSKSAQILEKFPEEKRNDVLRRVLRSGDVSEEFLHQVLEYVCKKATENLPPPSALGVSFDPIDKTVSLLKKLNPESKDHFLSEMDEAEKSLSDELKDRLFPFEELVNLDNRTIQKVLMNVDAGDLVVALKGASTAVSEALLSNLSKRARDNLMEEREVIGAVPLSQVKEAQKKIMEAVQGMVDSGEIKISNQEEDPLVE